MADDNEVQLKHRKVVEYLRRKGLDGVLLSRRANIAWLTGGARSYIYTDTDLAVGTACVTPKEIKFLSASFDATHLAQEEMPSDVHVESYPWYKPHRRLEKLQQWTGGGLFAADLPIAGLELPALGGDFDELRYELLPAELQRYRRLGAIAGAAIARVCREIQPGLSELEVAAMLTEAVMAGGARAPVVLIASDERIYRFRHPLPTAKKIDKHVMVVLCAEQAGLIASVTRLVYFGKLPQELVDKHHAVVNVDAAFNLGTRPGRTLGEILADAQAAYAQAGFADEWKLHHQGGSAGYCPRDVLGTPDEKFTVRANQVYAWNPSITGTKSEDSIIVGDSSPEFITTVEDWPTIEASFSSRKIMRPDVLAR